MEYCGRRWYFRRRLVSEERRVQGANDRFEGFWQPELPVRLRDGADTRVRNQEELIRSFVRELPSHSFVIPYYYYLHCSA